MDVASLYTNIPHEQGFAVIFHPLPSNEITSAIVKLSRFVLEHNYFIFDDKLFLQKKGTAMGTKMAPQYANIFMADLEEAILRNCNFKPLLYLRYLDDFFLFEHMAKKIFKIFIKNVNTHN